MLRWRTHLLIVGLSAPRDGVPGAACRATVLKHRTLFRRRREKMCGVYFAGDEFVFAGSVLPLYFSMYASMQGASEWQ